MKVPTYLIVLDTLGAIYGVFEMWWVKNDSKKNPQKYQKEEEPRVKSFFDVI